MGQSKLPLAMSSHKTSCLFVEAHIHILLKSMGQISMCWLALRMSHSFGLQSPAPSKLNAEDSHEELLCFCFLLRITLRSSEIRHRMSSSIEVWLNAGQR